MPDTPVNLVLGAAPSSPSASTLPSSPPPPSPPPPQRPGPTVVWFRGHDLRVRDHPALDAAVAASRPVLALYVLERGADTDGLSPSDVPASPPAPLSPNGGFALGRVQRWYLHHSLCVLRAELAALGITLVLRRVDCAEDTATEVADVASAVSAAAVFWNKRYKPRAYPVDDDVRSRLAARAVVAHDFDSETLMPPYATGRGRYDDFQSYTRFWIDAMREHPPPRPRPPLTSDTVCAMSRHRVETLLAASRRGHDVHMLPPNRNGYSPTAKPLPDTADLELLDGLKVDGDDSPGDVATIGCRAAEKALASFLKEERFQRFSLGTARRDGMVTGKHLATSRLSPHVRFGEISPRVLFYAVVDEGARAKLKGNMRGLEAARTFLKNMSLREFGYYMLGRYPSAAWKPIMPEFEVFPWVYDENGALTKAWETGTTGFPIVDAAMRQLIREGWIHNRMRFLAASFFCKYLLLPWPIGAGHMVRTLVDGDEACNSLGWQWTAGCNSDSFPFSTLVNPLSLFNHTQSTKRAADYVRKYVPELSGLPDSLVFTPWKATPEERRLYRLNIVSHDDFRRIKSEWTHAPLANLSEVSLYPNRIVNGPQARTRARNAMEVMRRIFSAQRQCRTVIVDQTMPHEGSTMSLRNRPRMLDPVQIELIEDHMSTVTSRDSRDLDKGQNKRSRSAEETPAKPLEPPRKRKCVPIVTNDVAEKTTSSEVSDLLSASNMAVGNRSSVISRGEVDLLLSSREVKRDASADAAHNRRRPACEVSVSAGLDSGESKESGNSPEGTAKRPRSSNAHSPPISDGRLSVQALLTPTIQDPSRLGTRKKDLPPELPSWPGSGGSNSQSPSDPSMQLGTPILRPPEPKVQVQLPFVSGQVAPLQAPSPMSFRSNYGKHIGGGSDGVRRQEMASPPLSQSNAPVPNPYVGRTGRHISRTQVGEFEAGPAMTSLRQVPSDGQHKARQTDVGTFRRSDLVAGSHVPNVVLAVHPSALKENHLAHPQGFDSSRVPNNGMYQPGIPQMPVLANHFQTPQPHNGQIMVPFRPTPPMPVGHQPGPLHSQDGSQRYFHAMPHLPAQHIAGHAQPMIFYPGMQPHLDMRVPGIGGTHVPQLIHPMLAPHPNALSIGYAPGGGPPGAGPSNGTMVHRNGNQGHGAGGDQQSRRGPTSPMEREEIARRMAAMDYYDDAYGGKHWEQWQAIALHLLEQYEFSEDTDRQTSKAYVRLCALKDELRDANPTGPRVTVNHCKEVFRILNLHVTGEWDRRGHGGVRGPYCYGCVRRSGVQTTSKK